mgnify:CR=1 FL=1
MPSHRIRHLDSLGLFLFRGYDTYTPYAPVSSLLICISQVGRLHALVLSTTRLRQTEHYLFRLQLFQPLLVRVVDLLVP